MKSIILCLVLGISLTALIPARSFAQGASPLELGSRIVPDVLGVLVGPNFNYASGTFDTGCPCTFTGGFGIGPSLGVMYEKNLLSPSPNWRLGTLNFGARLLYEQRNISSAFREYENTSIESIAQKGQFFTVPILFRHLAETSFTMLTLTPYLSWSPFTQAQGILQGVYFQAGLQGGYVFNQSLKHTKFSVNETVKLPNGEVALIEFAATGKNSVVVQDSASISSVNRIQFGVSIAAGADIPLGREGGRFRLSPLVQYTFPFTTLADYDGGARNFRISTLHILLGIKMNLQDVSN
jgi:Outer membrane protein beta-barrel domain